MVGTTELDHLSEVRTTVNHGIDTIVNRGIGNKSCDAIMINTL